MQVWTCLHNRGRFDTAEAFTAPGLPIPLGPLLHLDLSEKKEPVLTVDLSIHTIGASVAPGSGYTTETFAAPRRVNKTWTELHLGVILFMKNDGFPRNFI